MSRATRVLLLLVAALACAAPAASAATLDAGALRAEVTADPWSLRFTGPPPQATLAEAAGLRLGFRTAAGTHRATRVLSENRVGDTLRLVVATDDPAGRSLAVVLAPDGDGIVALTAEVLGGGTSAADVLGVGVGFAAPDGERHLGFGERSNAVDQRGNEVEHYVAEGPYQPAENSFIGAFVPAPGFRPRPDATYFPIPWLLSSRGFGVLADGDDNTVFDLSGDAAWKVETPGRKLALRVFAGPYPADALRRYTARVGRQPPAAAPFFFGPWWQPSGGDAQSLDTLKAAKAAGSVVQTYTHYLPCADQQTDRERERTKLFHDAGLAVTTYFNPMVCTTHPRYAEGEARKAYTRNALGEPYEYRYTGSSQFFVAQLDFAGREGPRFFHELLTEAVGDGYDGWMEDFGEYTPLDARASDGTTGVAAHNRYVEQYHRAAHAFSKEQSRPLARFNRSGWTGTARSSQIVWGGDPSTTWDFDGLTSSVRNGLTMGLSGVSLWGSDIGGFFALTVPQTTPELLARWLQVGFASGVMRTQANGFGGDRPARAQIFKPESLPIWTRYARLRTQLYPYVAAAQAAYDRTGLPIMRHLSLPYPGDPRATARDDEYLFGGSVLVAPVLSPGATQRTLYVPGGGQWVDWWRSVRLDADGAPHLRSPSLQAGGRDATLPAPLDELPMLVRAGAVLPMLDPDVETLTDYGAGETVRLADRADRMRLLAWPRGYRVSALGPAEGDRAISSEGDRGWTLRLRGARQRTYEVEAALGTLAGGGFAPCRVLVNTPGRPPQAVKGWAYDAATGVVTFKVRAKSARVQVLRGGCAGR